MFPGFPGRYVIKREPLNCITRVRSQNVNYSFTKSSVFTEPRKGGPGYWLWISLKRESLPEELLAIIRAVNRELRAGAPIVECPGGMVLRDWLEEHEPIVVGEYDHVIARRGHYRPDYAK
jgi:hypothetical protein